VKRSDEPPALAPSFPFPDEAEWRRYEPVLAAERLPAYDPSRHARPIRSSWRERLMLLPGRLFYVPVILPLLALLFLLPRRERGK